MSVFLLRILINKRPGPWASVRLRTWILFTRYKLRIWSYFIPHVNRFTGEVFPSVAFLVLFLLVICFFPFLLLLLLSFFFPVP